jgi:tRNA(fMet)-specific endonuclease VapC
MYLVETSTISLHQRGHPRVAARLAAIAPVLRFTSVVTIEELMRGRLATIAQHSQQPQRLVAAYSLLEQTLAYLHSWQVLPFTDADYQIFAKIRGLGIRVGTRDLRIAATALNHQMTVVTANVSDFARVPGLTVEDWSA